MAPSAKYLLRLAALLLFACAPAGGPLRAQIIPFVVAYLGNSSAVNAVALSPDGRRALSAGHDNVLRLWDAPTGLLLRTFDAQTASINAAAFSPDGRRILSAGDDGRLRLWEAATGRLLLILEGHRAEALAAAFSPDGRQALSGSRDSTVGLWDLETGLLLKTFEGHAGATLSVTFSPNGLQALSAGADRTIRLWDTATGQNVRTLKGHSDEATSAVFMDNGRRVLSASRDRTLKLWDAATGRLLRTFAGHTDEVLSAAVSSSGGQALSAGKDRTLKLWDTASGRLIRTFAGHMDIVTSVALSPDGLRALSGSWDKTLKVWDLTRKDGDPAAGQPAGTIDLQATTFSPNGHFSFYFGQPLPGTPDLSRLDERLWEKGLRRGDPVFLRLFKADLLAELWMKRGGRFELFATYPICAWSGQLGPKQLERDYQSPEGFYTIARNQLNPNSHFHRAFNLGYPNALDQALHRTGAHLMVHGGCKSVGCYAMTDPVIDELWSLVTAALNNGQERVGVHVFPFRLTEARLAAFAWHPWAGFWRDLKQGQDLFEASHVPPQIGVCDKRYVARRGDPAARSAPMLLAACPSSSGGAPKLSVSAGK